jgi:RNA polymerase sigma-70 factor (ECF subfamily)
LYRADERAHRINLQAAIGRLPEGYKAMFLLHNVYGCDHQAIAAMRGCSVENSIAITQGAKASSSNPITTGDCFFHKRRGQSNERL